MTEKKKNLTIERNNMRKWIQIKTVSFEKNLYFKRSNLPTCLNN